jgi:type II secretory pathway pseudopilin PulG
MGLVEVLVASALMAVALVVLLGSLSSLLLGARVAERRTVEMRLARNQIERLMAPQTISCPVPTVTQSVDHVTYSIETTCPPVPSSAGYIELKVTVHPLQDPSSQTLVIDRVQQ